jgi:succinate dehydrogenase hydrophobic anchor subunit
MDKHILHQMCYVHALILVFLVLFLLGVCFVAEDPKEREHLRKILSGASAEAITYRGSA